jgi:ABC-type transport system involved in multi-copper enzyme maturation permease subunit
MIGTRTIGLYKEARALSTTWALAAAALIAMSWWGARPGFELGLAAYIAGAVFLGAESVGQEYTNRTLPLLLSQPIDRRRIYLQKVGVLIVMLLLLAAVQWAMRGDEWQQLAEDRQTAAWLLPVIGGALIAPWLTMITRSTLGGAALTCFSAGIAWMVLLAVPIVRFGSGADEAGAIALGYMPRVIVLFSVIAAVLGWRTFTALEAIDGEVAVIALPRWIAPGEGRRGYRPWRAMLSKELHLQQLTFGITIQYFVVWGTIGWLLHLVPAWRDFPLHAVTTVYCMILPVVIGAIASAEERHHGMLQGQLLQPIPHWQQWIAKAGVTFSLALIFGVGLPVLLAAVAGDEGTTRMAGLLITTSILLTAMGLYLSSLSTSAVRALVALLPVGAAFMLFVQTVFAFMPPGQPLPSLPSWSVFVALISAVLVGLAFINHRSTERRPSRIAAQALSLAVVVLIGLIAAR